MKGKKCPDCRIPMKIVRDTEDVTYFRCRNCGREEKEIKDRKIYVQY